MFYVYRNVRSTSARDLAEALDGRRIREVGNLRRGDVLVCWGSTAQRLNDGVKALNNVPVGNKLEDVEKLRKAGVETITIARQRPAVREAQAARPAQPAQAAFDPAAEHLQVFRGQLQAFLRLNGRPTEANLQEIVDNIIPVRQALRQPIREGRPAVPAQPAIMAEMWLPRIVDHVGGLDLLRPPAQPEFWVRKEDIVNEFRIHSFRGKSIRSAIKVPREDVQNVHEWVRSWDGGWRMAYREGALGRNPQRVRDLAHKAVGALGLDFGAVDIGEKRDGTLIVLEVNRAPGLGPGTTEAYARAIREWSQGAR